MVFGLHGRIGRRVRTPGHWLTRARRFLTIKENTQERAKPHAASVYGQLRPGQTVSRQPILRKVSRHLHAANINDTFSKSVRIHSNNRFAELAAKLNVEAVCFGGRACCTCIGGCNKSSWNGNNYCIKNHRVRKLGRLMFLNLHCGGRCVRLISF